RTLVDGAAVVPATHARIDPELLFDCRPGEERLGQLSFDDLRLHDHDGEEAQTSAPHAGRLHAGYDSCSHSSEPPNVPRAQIRVLDRRPEGLFRIKGYVDFGPYDVHNRYAVHAVGRFLRFRPEPWAPDEERLTQLVLIGSGIDAPALRKELEACASDTPQADERGMWGVLRYVDGTEDDDPDAHADPDPPAPAPA